VKISLNKKEVTEIIADHYGIRWFDIKITSAHQGTDELCVICIDSEISVAKKES